MAILPERHHYDLAIQRHLTTFADLGPKGRIGGPLGPYVPLSGLRRTSFGVGHAARRCKTPAPLSMIAVCGSTGPDTEPEPPQTAIMKPSVALPAFNPNL